MIHVNRKSPEVIKFSWSGDIEREIRIWKPQVAWGKILLKFYSLSSVSLIFENTQDRIENIKCKHTEFPIAEVGLSIDFCFLIVKVR